MYYVAVEHCLMVVFDAHRRSTVM